MNNIADGLIRCPFLRRLGDKPDTHQRAVIEQMQAIQKELESIGNADDKEKALEQSDLLVAGVRSRLGSLFNAAMDAPSEKPKDYRPVMLNSAAIIYKVL